MKAKKFDKKLSLNKETVSNLTDDQLDSVRGGTDATCVYQTCDCTKFIPLCRSVTFVCGNC